MHYFSPMKFYIIFISLFALISCSRKDYKEPHVLIKTSYGDIELELYPDRAPQTVAAFLANIEAGHFAKASFYRVLKNEDVPAEYNQGLIQGGIFQANPALVPGIPKLAHESPKTTGLSHVSGTISKARTTPGSATTEGVILNWATATEKNNEGFSIEGERGTTSPEGTGASATCQDIIVL
ncbi:MAG: hypothetical protein EOO13_18570 [Chitinophagaceae bacterium]|nr:MAG: hypothetical protein EOO13_18570 [Chitinophagaceae bacterium]